MASTGPGEQYIGSKIWLISKLEIRYEGILHSIDSNEATLALSQVRGFGTEDRAEVVIPPREEVYDLVLFRASDIKDIRLCDTPKPQPPPERIAAPYDPAIIQVQSATHGIFPGSGLHHHPGVAPPHIRHSHGYMVPSYPGYGGFAPTAGLAPNLMPPVPAPSMSQSSITFSGIGTDLGPVGPPPHPDGPSEDDAAHMQGGLKSGSTTPLAPSESGGSRKVSESESRTDDGSGAARAVGGGQRGQDNRRPSRGRYDKYSQNNYHQRDYEDRREGGGYRGARGGYERGGYEHRGSRGGYESRGRGNYHREQHRDTTQSTATAAARPTGGATKLKFDQEFDFERANQDFERVLEQLSKTKISDTTTEKTTPIDVTTTNAASESKDSVSVEDKEAKLASEDACYNKTKSFFDTISCEALERSKGGYQRPDWQKERQLNVETFGIKPRGGGGYRGGYTQGYNNQGYGGYRGYNPRGNYYRNNYNRDNREGYNRDNRDSYNRENYSRDYREGYNRDQDGYVNKNYGYRGNAGGYASYHDNRGRGRGQAPRGGYRGGRGRTYEEHDERTDRTEKPEGRNERGRGSYASRI